MRNVPYLASWFEKDPDISSLQNIPNKHVWVLWDGELIDHNEPPKRIKILLTGLEYTWQEFQKIRKKKF